jgi:hypothetical protein
MIKERRSALMGRRKYYFLILTLCTLVMYSNLGQVFASPGRFTGDEVYLNLKNKYEWEFISDTVLEDYLTKGLYFTNHKEEDGYDMSLIIPKTDSYGGVIEGFNVMLENESEAIRLFIDMIDNKNNFKGNYAGRQIEIKYNDKNTTIMMYSIKEN